MTIQASKGSVMGEQPRTLADLRHAAGLSQEQVAQRMGVGKARILHIEAKFPNINYGTLTRYISAVGGSIQFTVGTTHTYADQIVPDPEKRGTRKYLNERASAQGVKRMNATAAFSSLPEELPLQRDAAQPGGDDPGGHEDHPDAESDQGDGNEGQQA